MDSVKTNTPLRNWTDGYFTSQPPIDECFHRTGGIKDHWKRLLENLNHLEEGELKLRSQELSKLLEENGVTYNVYGDPNGLNRPWLLDTLPFIIDNTQWATIERGMKQRAFVLNKVLEDIYGERKLLRDGIIPPELIYAHSGFLRASDKIRLPGEHQLILYAADLSRGPDGKAWILRDRTQAPSGMGYALENRSAFSRILPELFNQHQVSKLGGFFNTLIQALIRIAPQGKEQPRIVLLTPGPRNETYFEHAFLSSYLGFTLAQGEDMQVRDGHVWIKTVEGLEKVDVIVRRVDDSYCDPLELREDSQLGIPGLLEVIRKGNVAIANPLGSSILENTGLMAFMHNIFRYFLNEDPIFPMVATWWCGQEKEMNYVLQNLDTLVVKKIDRLTGSETKVGATLSKTEKDELIRRIRHAPYMYVGQEALNLSTSPVFTKGKLEPRYTVVRTFVAASEHDYELMPGGLTRCSPEKGTLIVSNQEGGISKDTWIESRTKLVGTTIKGRDIKRKDVLPSRAAENLYWVGRYAQRVIRTSRFIRIALRNLSQTGYLSSGQESEATRALLITVTHLTHTYPGFLDLDEDLSLEDCLNEIHRLICDGDCPGSLMYTVNNMLKAMYAVRDKWSVDNWRVIDEIENVKRRVATLEPQNIRHVFSLLDQLNMGLLSFLEMNRQSLYRGEGWVLYRVGQLIEEISLELTQYRSLLGFAWDEATEFQLLEALLVSNQALSNYRSVYRTYFDVAPAIDLLFINKQNPISLLSQMEEMLKYLERLPSKERSRESDITSLAFECYSKIRLVRVGELAKVDNEGVRKELDTLCATLTEQISTLSNKLSAAYFSHSTYQYQGAKDNFHFEV
jgi:uncharacterized circularly permuted ATP-grasp superfamily protein/uncharacterized alpha-E superfamily protein